MHVRPGRRAEVPLPVAKGAPSAARSASSPRSRPSTLAASRADRGLRFAGEPLGCAREPRRPARRSPSSPSLTAPPRSPPSLHRDAHRRRILTPSGRAGRRWAPCTSRGSVRSGFSAASDPHVFHSLPRRPVERCGSSPRTFRKVPTFCYAACGQLQTRSDDRGRRARCVAFSVLPRRPRRSSRDPGTVTPLSPRRRAANRRRPFARPSG